MVRGVEGEVLGEGKYLRIQYTLLFEPVADAAPLTSAVHSIWSHPLDEIANAGNIKPSEKGLDLVSGLGHDKIQGVLLSIKDKAKTLRPARAIRISYKR